MKNNGSSGNVVKKKQLKNSTTKKRRRIQKNAKKNVYTNDIHNVITKNVKVDHYSTVELNNLNMQSKYDTAIKYSISQPLKKTEQLNKLKRDLKFRLNKRVTRKKHLKRSGFIYHPEVVTKYVYNHKSQLNSEIQPNHPKTQEFLRSLNQPNIVSELQYLDKNNNVNHIDTDDWSTKNKAEYANMENLNDKQEYLHPRDHLSGINREKLNIIPKVEPITKANSIMFNTEYFEKHDLIDLLDYKNKKLMLDNNLDNFNNNENMDIIKKSTSVAILKSEYFSKLSKILKPKNIGKRDDDTENPSYEIGSTNIDLLHKDNEKNYIEHDYVFKEELRKIAENSNKLNKDNQKTLTESAYKTVPIYTPNEKNERDDINDYSVLVDLENTLAVDNTLSNPDMNLHNKTTVKTSPGLRLQERFGQTATDLKQTQISLITKPFIRPSIVRSQNNTGT